MFSSCSKGRRPLKTLKDFGVYIRESHIFTPRITKPHELAEHLSKNIIFHKRGLLAVNKPQGISFAGPESSDKSESLNLQKCVSAFKKLHGLNNLFNAHIPDRHISGVAIFTTNEKFAERVRFCLRNMRLKKEPYDTFQALVIGTPLLEVGGFNGVIKLKHRPDIHKKKAIFSDEWSGRSVKLGVAKRIVLNHKLLKFNNNISLVEVVTTRNKWNSVRTYLTSKLLCPVLGDNLFGSRVKTILGKPVEVDMFSPVASLPQKLTPDLIERLDLKGRQNVQVPLHLHLGMVQIRNLFKKNETVVLKAPYPNFFQWTLERCELSSAEPQVIAPELLTPNQPLRLEPS